MPEKNLAPVAHNQDGVGSIDSEKNNFGQLWIKPTPAGEVCPECDTGVTSTLGIHKMLLGFN